MIYSTERVHEQNQVKESRRLWINSFNPAHFSTDRKYAEIAIKSYAKRKDGRPKHFFAEMVVDPISRTRRVIRCCTFKPWGAGLTHGCGFCREDRGNLHPADGYVAGLPSSTYPSHLSDDYLDAVESVRF
ncbi:hypothetical protein OROMI_009560 [Orobanche minor]